MIRFLKTCCLVTVFVLSAVFSVFPVLAEGNPYSGGWANCTWSAWELVYENSGVEMPALGNAGDWLENAKAYGTAVGPDPVPGSVGVWSGGLGHVAYISTVDKDSVYVQEGGFAGDYHEGWITDFSTRYGKTLLGYIYPGRASAIEDADQEVIRTALMEGLTVPVSMLPEKEELSGDDFGFSVFRSLSSEKALFSDTERALLKIPAADK